MTTQEQPTPEPAQPKEEEAPTEPGQASEGEEFTKVPNEMQAPTPAGNEYSQEGGPTVEEQAANAAANELDKQKQTQQNQ